MNQYHPPSEEKGFYRWSLIRTRNYLVDSNTADTGISPMQVSEISWLQRISLSGQFYGMRAEPVTLRVIHGRAPDDPDAPYGAHTLTLEPEPGSATGLSFLPETSQEGHAQLRRLAESYIAHHLTLGTRARAAHLFRETLGCLGSGLVGLL